MKEGFYAQLKVVFDKLTEAESRFHRSPQEMNQCKTILTTNCPATQFGICGKGELSLGGATSGTAGVYPWHQATPHSSKSETSQIQSALQTSEMFSQPLTLSDFSGSELLRRLAAAKEQQDYAHQESQVEGYNFTPYVVYEPAEEASLQRVAKPISTVIVEECDDTDDEAVVEESEDSTDENLSYASTEGEEDNEENEDSNASSSPMASIQSSQTQPQFLPSQRKPLTSPLKPVPIQSTCTPAENAGPANLPSHVTGRRFLTSKGALKASKKQDEDCVIVYEVRASMSNREKASRLFLSLNFFNYTKQEVCPGCRGCRRVARESTTLSKKEDEQSTVVSPSEENIGKPEKSASGTASYVFGQSSIVGQLTVSPVKPKQSGAFSLTHNKDGAKPFQGAGTQFFVEITEDVEGQDEDKLHFEPVIPLPDEIKVVTGEEGLVVLFSERAKLYRFDADSGQWKERGIGDVKLLRHPKSGQGRVLMRREQTKKLCANHNINSGMELKPNVGSDRSWVWYTPADYAEGVARPEKLAIKLKSAEIAGKFREVFEDLEDTSSAGMPPEVKQTDAQQGAGCALYKQLISTFADSSYVWTCEMCYVENSTKDSNCIACNSAKPESLEPLSKTEEEDAKVTLTSTNTSVVESVELNTFQDFNKDSTSGGSIFQSPGLKGLASSQLFTIGRVESSEDKLDDEIYLTPSKMSSPSKQGVTPQNPSTTLFQENVISRLPFGTNTPAKFTFSLQLSPESPSRTPKSPLPPASPLSSESPGHAEDDGRHFEPLIPLPEKVDCRTGEEGQEVMFCERGKLFRYDSDASQWKERGVGDIKILLNPSSGRYRVLMRREHVFKLCANHMISVDMELKPFPNSDRAWLWTTLADCSDEVAAAETLGARFKTSQVAAEFKDTFDKATQSLKSEVENIASSGKLDVKETDEETGKKRENDILFVFEKRVADDQKERAKPESLEPLSKTKETDAKVTLTSTNTSVVESVELNTFQDFNKDSTSGGSIFQLPGLKGLASSQLFTIGRVESSEDKLDDEIYLTTSKMSSPSKQGVTPQNPSTTLFQENVISRLPFGTNTPAKFTFSLQLSPESPSRTPKSPLPPASPLSSESPGHAEDDGPHFEPLIPLPEKVDCRTGEEGQEVMFCERCKLFRYDSDASQWKERGVGDIKILLNPSSGRYRVLMRREHVFKLCANHMISVDMELKPFPNSDRAWLWTTLADCSDEVAAAETLGARFKTSQVAAEFKHTFDKATQSLKSEVENIASSGKLDVKETDEETGKKRENDILFVFEKRVADDQKERAKPESLEPLSKTKETDAKVTLTSTNTSVVESVKLNTFQDFNKDSTSGGSIFQLPGLKGLASSQLFTIGRVESSEDKLDDEIYLTPSKMSPPSKQGVTPQNPSTTLFQENVISRLPFGTNTPAKFTFSLQLSPESPSRTPKSPLPPASPFSSESPGHAEDDGPHFEPLIPLPEKVDCRTGEEGQEVMFCERCKLFRYDSDASQWKERGVGDIKILLNPSSGRYRVLMRREHVFKLCANHMISMNMELKPFPNSDRAWLWTTLADCSDEVAAAETLGARFKTSQVAAEFKHTFDKATQSLKFEVENIASSGKPDVEETDEETGKKRENDILFVFEKRVTDDQKERAKRLELPSNFYGFEDSAPGSDSRESEPVARRVDL